MILNGIKINFLVGALFSVCLMGIMSGICVSWSSPVVPKLQSDSNDNPLEQQITTFQASLMTSMLTLGACVGCSLFGYLADAAGRRFALCALNIPIFLSFTMMVIFPKLTVFYVARFIAGLAVGGGQVVTTTFNSEVTNKYNRGVFMTFSGMMVSVGNLIGYCIGAWIPVSGFNITVATISVLTVILVFIFCKETPYYYLINNKEEMAENSLRLYRGMEATANIKTEIMEIRKNIKEQQEGNLLQILKTKCALRSFTLSTVLLIFQQLTGITGILMYSQKIFDTVGSNLSSNVSTIILGATQVISGGLAPLVSNKFKRKTVLMYSALGMAISEFVLGIYCYLEEFAHIQPFRFLPIICLCIFILNYNYGVGPLCWIVGGEVYPTRIKNIVMPISIAFYHFVGFLIVQYFNFFEENLGIGIVFVIFAGFCMLSIVYVQLYVVETKDKTLEEIQRELNN